MCQSTQRLANVRCLAVILAAVWALPLFAAEIDHGEQYRACLALVYRQADKALESAKAWWIRGGGKSAGHCAALALLELGRLGEAAKRLEGLAMNSPDSAKVPAEALLAQAANIWLLADDLEEARRVIAKALELAPDDADILIDRARILAAGGAYGEALADLDRSLTLKPADSDTHAFRASALRRLGQNDAAFQAIELAIDLDSKKPSAWFERGAIRRALGDKLGAEADWRETLRQFDGTPAADAALVELESLGAAVE